MAGGGPKAQPECCDWRLCSRLVLNCFCNSLHVLFIGKILIVCIFIKLLELSYGLISGLNRSDDMHVMSWRIVL